MNIGSADLDTRVRIERQVPAAGAMSAGQEPWTLVAEVWASVRDLAPRRSERAIEDLDVATRAASIVIRWRGDVTAAMRVVCGDRVMQIVAPPAMLERRRWLQLLAEDTSTAGQPA